jgi:hypothetical protein
VGAETSCLAVREGARWCFVTCAWTVEPVAGRLVMVPDLSEFRGLPVAFIPPILPIGTSSRLAETWRRGRRAPHAPLATVSPPKCFMNILREYLKWRTAWYDHYRPREASLPLLVPGAGDAGPGARQRSQDGQC